MFNKKIIKILILVFLIVNLSSNFLVYCQPTETSKENSSSDFVICIDPGHQKRGDNKGEPIAPGSSYTKPRVSAGTAGIATKKAEHVVNLEASMILKELLLDKGYNVVMTRENEEVNLSNIERAEIANNANANIAIRIHCDSINNGGKVGASILVPAKNNKCTKDIYDDSVRYANILKENMQNSDVKVNGIFERSDITGFNWSKVPVIILEMGFMSNYNEDEMLSNPDYQRKLMECVVKSIDEYKIEKVVD